MREFCGLRDRKLADCAWRRTAFVRGNGLRVFARSFCAGALCADGVGGRAEGGLRFAGVFAPTLRVVPRYLFAEPG